MSVLVFFKQKTAYEMRISDWSSDVCSSDLIMDEIAALTPTLAGVHYDRLEEEGSLQWPASEAAPDGTPTMHVDGFVRGKGKFVVTDYVPTDENARKRDV